MERTKYLFKLFHSFRLGCVILVFPFQLKFGFTLHFVIFFQTYYLLPSFWASFIVKRVNSVLLYFRETSSEWRSCPWPLSHPLVSRWTNRCSRFTWNTDSWASPWKQPKRRCPCASLEKGRRFTTTSCVVRMGEFCGYLFLQFPVWG